MIVLRATKSRLVVIRREYVASGASKVYDVEFRFSPEWDGLQKVAMFRVGQCEPSDPILLPLDGHCQIPAEILYEPGKMLYVGVMGIASDVDPDHILPYLPFNKRDGGDGEAPPVDPDNPDNPDVPPEDSCPPVDPEPDPIVFPTMWCQYDIVRRGVQSSNVGLTEAVVEMGKIRDESVTARDGAEAARDEALEAADRAVTASVNPPKPSEEYTWLIYDQDSQEYVDTGSPSRGEPGEAGPPGEQGENGTPGKSAYELAVDNGFSGSETEWLDSLKNGPPGPAGPPGKDGKDGADGAPGERGPQGLQGVKGDKGDKGDPGPAGKDGAPGAKGDPGAIGPPGPQGATGAAGSPGPKGDRGDVGPAGPQGDKGDKGDPGPRGLQGVAGPAGVQGEKGDQGLPGPAGPKGDQGEKGDKGDKGDPGEPGAQGLIGPKGEAGVTPNIGDNGHWFIGDVDTGVNAVGSDAEVAPRVLFTKSDADHDLAVGVNELIETSYAVGKEPHKDDPATILWRNTTTNLTYLAFGTVLAVEVGDDGISSRLVSIDSVYLIAGSGEGEVGGATAYMVKSPIGTIVAWGRTVDNVPSGWIICDGQNGTPDLRGRFILGSSDSHAVGEMGGEETVTLKDSEIPEHRHAILDSPIGSYLTTNTGNDSVYPYRNGASTRQTGFFGGNQPHNNMPPYYTLIYIMKITADATDGVTESQMNTAITTAVADKMDKFEVGSSLELTANARTAGGRMEVKTPVKNVLTQAEFDALPEVERNKGLYVISDGSGPGGSSGGVANNVYSEEETLVGTWMGKPLYRRVLSFTFDTEVIHDTISLPADIVEFLRVEAMYYTTSSVIHPLPFVNGAPDPTLVISVYAYTNHSTYGNAIFFNRIGSISSANGKKVRVIVEYTKEATS